MMQRFSKPNLWGLCRATEPMARAQAGGLGLGAALFCFSYSEVHDLIPWPGIWKAHWGPPTTSPGSVGIFIYPCILDDPGSPTAVLAATGDLQLVEATTLARTVLVKETFIIIIC